MAEVKFDEILNRLKYQIGDAIVGKAISDAASEKLEAELNELRLQLAETQKDIPRDDDS